MNPDPIDWSIIHKIVDPEHQYREVLDPPLEPVRMAWPFKTEAELRILSKWFKEQARRDKQKEINQVGEALL